MPRKQRVLIVEDEALVAMDLRTTLSRAGYDVLGPVPRPDAALRLARSRHPDCALLDVNLSGRKSYALADDLLRMNIPVVFTTGYEAGALPERFRAWPCLGKPVDPGELATALARILAPAAGET